MHEIRSKAVVVEVDVVDSVDAIDERGGEIAACRVKTDEGTWKVAVLAACVVGFGLGCGGSGRNASITIAGNTQGTTFSIKVVPNPDRPVRTADLERVVNARLATIDKSMSLYRPDSELSMFNATDGTEDFSASPLFIEAMEAALAVCAATDGAFDITVKPLIDAWGFGAGARRPEPPSEKEIERLLSLVDYRKIEVDRNKKTIRRGRPGVTCNLNGIAQGFTVDKLADDIEALGSANYMIEVGGEIRARGMNSRGEPWQIGIEKPHVNERAVQEVVALSGAGLSTSGDYRNYYEENGVRISHTIDPATGHPIGHTLASVSVVEPSCARADGYATALMVMGPDKGYAWAVEHDVAALFLVHDGPDRFVERTTPGFANR